MSPKMVALLIFAAVGCAQSPALRLNQTLTSVAKPSGEDVPSNLTGEELAGRILTNVVKVRNIARAGDEGTGLIVGVSGATRFILTASHVISSEEGGAGSAASVSHQFELTRCDVLQQKSSPL